MGESSMEVGRGTPMSAGVCEVGEKTSNVCEEEPQ